jgi:hypothetical protein
MAWGCATRPLDPEHGSGDRSLVVRRANGILFAVVDGLGHGAAAADAAQLATESIEQYAEPDLLGVVHKCHERMRATRGATVALAWVDTGTATLTWLGIGNVAGVLHRKRHGPVSSPQMPQFGGIVGRRIYAGRPARVRVRVGDTLVVATDGVDRRFADHVPAYGKNEEQLAQRLIASHANERDDALVLVARCTEGPP